MIKGILIDLGGTIIENNNFSFTRLFNKIYELNNNKDIGLEEFLKINKHLLSLTYDNRKEIEIRFIDYLRYLQQYFQLQFTKALEAVEIDAVLGIIDTELIDGAKALLEFCRDKKLKIVAVSNSTFSRAVIDKQLSMFNLSEYFNDVLVSSQFLFRKPSAEFYKLALKTIDLNINEIIFIGNDYECDIIGPDKLGIKTCWFNKSNNENYNNINTLEINNYQDLINKLSENLI